MTKLLRWAALAAALGAAACGGNKNTPTTPAPFYNGSYQGSYTVSSCTENGQFGTLAIVCGSFANGSVWPYGMVINQADRTVSGTFVLGSINFAFSNTTIASDGSLTITGTGTAPGFGTVINITPTWTLRLNGSLLAGSITQIWSAPGVSGQSNIVGNISSSTKTTVVASQTAPAAVAPRSIGEWLSALRSAAQP